MGKNRKNWLIVASLFLILLAIVITIVFLLKGSMVKTGEWNRMRTTETVTCESSKITYPIYKYDNTDNRLLKIITTFANNNLDKISLRYQLKYDDATLARKSDAENQAAMNHSFNDNGLEPYAFYAKYSNINNVFQMTLYAKSEDLNKDTLKYFMLDALKNTNDYTKDSVVEAYTNKGLDCVYKELNNKEEEENNEN